MVPGLGGWHCRSVHQRGVSSRCCWEAESMPLLEASSPAFYPALNLTQYHPRQCPHTQSSLHSHPGQVNNQDQTTQVSLSCAESPETQAPSSHSQLRLCFEVSKASRDPAEIILQLACWSGGLQRGLPWESSDQLELSRNEEQYSGRTAAHRHNADRLCVPALVLLKCHLGQMTQTTDNYP